uniref:Uncharacterized protein n=1 Tax=Avena sativa TaxID=4498 RepID=A0ACD5YIZ9_AVESA
MLTPPSPRTIRPSQACRPAFSITARTSSASVASQPKKSLFQELQRQLSFRFDEASQVLKNAPHMLLDAIVDSTFKFTDQALLPSESNFAPVDEICGPINLLQIEGEIPKDFPQGVYIRNVSNHAMQLRFGKVNKSISNTNVFEHQARLYAITESHQPEEICIQNLETGKTWDIQREWDRPCTSHPKVAPGSGELVIFGSDAKRPFLVVGVVSDDGTKLKHKVDLKLDRPTLCHDIGVTLKYNIIMDLPLTADIGRVTTGGQLIEFEKEGYARIGVMPRYGDAESVMWFDVEPCCMFHLINCFEDGNEVVVQGLCSADSIIPGPRLNKHDMIPQRSELTSNGKTMKRGIDEKFFSRLYEWRLNLERKTVAVEYLTGTEWSLEFPTINNHYTVLPKYGGFAKLCLEERENATKIPTEDLIKMEIHPLDEDQFCSGTSFVPRVGGSHEDDGWIISFVHNERTNISQVHIIDTQEFEGPPSFAASLEDLLGWKETLESFKPMGMDVVFMRWGVNDLHGLLSSLS